MQVILPRKPLYVLFVFTSCIRQFIELKHCPFYHLALDRRAESIKGENLPMIKDA